MDKFATIDELLKLGAISDDQARQSLDRLNTLERSKPTTGQVGRYAALGAVAGPAMGAVSNVIKGKRALDFGTVSKLRGVAGEAAKGAIGMGAVPLARGHLDRRAETGTLKSYLKERSPNGVG